MNFQNETHIDFVDYGLNELNLEKYIYNWCKQYIVPLLSNNTNNIENFQMKGFILREVDSMYHNKTKNKIKK